MSRVTFRRTEQLGLHLTKRGMSTFQQTFGAPFSQERLKEEQKTDRLGQFSIPFAHSKLGSFFQARPVLHNQYLQDSFLISFLKRHLPKEHFLVVNADLERFGDRVAGEIYELSLQMEADQPKLEQIDAWGQTVNRLLVCPAWQKMKIIAAKEGLVACGYERNLGEWSRLYQIAKFYLFEPSGGLYGCPLAMTNGAAKTLELLKDQFPAVYQEAFPRLISRDPQLFWTSGQWMTEKQGGSDVGHGTETVAVEQPNGSYKLYGYKWFSSATDADISLTLARIINRNGNVVQGNRGLSMFYLPVKDENGMVNKIQMLKLKNKLGTHQLPTAELLIDGAIAYRISEQGRGVASIAHMLTLTRIHTAMGAASAMRRMVFLARDYATRRQAFRKSLHKHPLHVHTLAGMEVEARAAAIFVFEVARLLGRQEVLHGHQTLESEGEVLRLIVPLAKLYISKKSIEVTSEGLECFGGQGYIEDTDLPRILRDTQVHAIWEGTTNILSLDVLRAVRKSQGAVLGHFQKDVVSRLQPAKEVSSLQASAVKVEKAVQDLLQLVPKLSPPCIEMAAREFAFSLARIYMGALLLEHAAQEVASPADAYAAQRWCQQDLILVCNWGQQSHFSEHSQELDSELVFEGYLQKSQL